MRLVNTMAAIRACGVLHNMSRLFEDPVPEEEDADEDEENAADGGEEEVENADAHGGVVVRAASARQAGEAHRDHLLSQM
jgi:hypothetical protein